MLERVKPNIKSNVKRMIKADLTLSAIFAFYFIYFFSFLFFACSKSQECRVLPARGRTPRRARAAEPANSR